MPDGYPSHHEIPNVEGIHFTILQALAQLVHLCQKSPVQTGVLHCVWGSEGCKQGLLIGKVVGQLLNHRVEAP